MGIYNLQILPRLISMACGVAAVRKQRQAIVPSARGRVLEVGFGSGLNLPYYDSAQVQAVVGVDPVPLMRRLAEPMLASTRVPVELLTSSAEDIPQEDASFDTVLVTYSLCTIPDVRVALAELRRVLRPEGMLLFCEHGRSPDTDVRRWQDRITPVWKRVTGGCHLNRPIDELICESGFRIDQVDSFYIRGPRPLTYHFRGCARPVR